MSPAQELIKRLGELRAIARRACEGEIAGSGGAAACYRRQMIDLSRSMERSAAVTTRVPQHVA